MKASTSERIQTFSPNTGRACVRIDAEKYHAVRRAILAALPTRGEGLAFQDLPRAVRARLPGGAIPGGGSLKWYTTVVKLDLETRGEIVRVPDSRPQRLIRRAAAGRSRGVRVAGEA